MIPLYCRTPRARIWRSTSFNLTLMLRTLATIIIIIIIIMRV